MAIHERSSERPAPPGGRRELLPSVFLLMLSLVSYATLYAVRQLRWIPADGLIARVWWDLSATVLTAGIVLATLDRAQKRELDLFVRRLLEEQKQVAQHIMEQMTLRALLAEKMTWPVYTAIQEQILEEPVVIRNYRLALRIVRRADNPEYVDLFIHERYHLCNESPETRELPIACSVDLNYEDQFEGANKLSEVSIIPRPARPGPTIAQASPGVTVLSEKDLDGYAQRQGATVAYEIPAPRVAPGDEVLVSRRRRKVQRSTDVNFWRAAQPMESVELEIRHDEDIFVEAFRNEPWNKATVQIHRDPHSSVWVLTCAVLPHQGYDISWRDTRRIQNVSDGR